MGNVRSRAERKAEAHRRRVAAATARDIAGGQLLNPDRGNQADLRISRPLYIEPGSGLRQATWIVRERTAGDGGPPVIKMASVGGETVLQAAAVQLLAAAISSGEVQLMAEDVDQLGPVADRAVALAAATLKLAQIHEFPNTDPEGEPGAEASDPGRPGGPDSPDREPEDEGTTDGRKQGEGEPAPVSDRSDPKVSSGGIVLP